MTLLHPILEQYLVTFPEDRTALALLCQQIDAGEQLADRKNFTGHITGAGIVLSGDHSRILLIHHKNFNRWMQPGGHYEIGDTDPLAAARREVLEETGLQSLHYLPMLPDYPLVPVSISTHYIPANSKKKEPEHYHHDWRYVFETDETAVTPQLSEIHGAEWFAMDAPEAQEFIPAINRLLNGIS